MTMLQALLEGDYEQMIGAHPDIVYYANMLDFPYKQDDEDFPTYLSSFINSELFEVLEKGRVECTPLKNLRLDLKDLIDSEEDFYSSPVYIFDTHGQAYFIYDRTRQVFLDSDEIETNGEEILENLTKAKKDRSETVVIVWNIYQEKQV